MNQRIGSWLVWVVLILAMSGSVPTTFAQAQEQPTAPASDPGQQDRDPMGQTSAEMREMARAMKSMADMCQMMMKREKAARPYLIAATVSVGILLLIALLLFIVLEVQWIRFWSLRIKTERKNLGQ